MNVTKSIPDCLDPWLDTFSNCWSLEEHHYADVHAVCMNTQIQNPPLCSGILSSSARAATVSENQGNCLNCHETSHSLRQCRHPFRNLSGVLNPDLGTVGDDGETFCRWQELMSDTAARIIHDRRNTTGRNTGVVPVTRVGSTTARVSRTEKVMTITHTRNEDINSLTPAITVGG